jgi:ABC-2 type transport system permease protein
MAVAALLGKDLRILRRSPVLVALLIVYPIAIALLIGLALSSASCSRRSSRFR